MNIAQITDSHLINRIKFFEKRLGTRPHHVYIGISDYASDAVDMENETNDEIEAVLRAHVLIMKTEAKKRNLLTTAF